MSPVLAGRRHEPTLLLLIAVLVVGALGLALLDLPAPERRVAVEATIADVAPVHAGVRIGELAITRPARLHEGDALEPDADGRARVRLDGGAVVLLDRASRVIVRGAARPPPSTGPR